MRSQIYGNAPTLAAIRFFLTILFSSDSFASTSDASCLYINYYDMALLTDINELAMKMMISHLIQSHYIEEGTPVYRIYKVSQVNLEPLQVFRNTIHHHQQQQQQPQQQSIFNGKSYSYTHTYIVLTYLTNNICYDIILNMTCLFLF